MKKKVKMTQSAHGCEDGFTSRHYKNDEVYELTDHLADNFIAAGFAIPYECEEKAKQPHNNKSLSNEDYDNKSEKPNRRERSKS